MLKMSPPVGPGSQPADERKLAARQEIDAIQLYSLGKLIPGSKTSFFNRVVSRFEEDFFRQPLRQKIKFLIFGTRWVLQRGRARMARSTIPAFHAAKTGSSLRVAIHGTGSLGDFFTHMLFIQEFFRQFGPMDIDFYCHPKKVDDAKAVFAQSRMVKNVVNVNYLPALRDQYDLVVRIHYLIKYEVRNFTRIFDHNPDLLNVIGAAETRLQPYHFIFESHPFLDGVFARSIAWKGMNLADAVGDIANLPINRKTIPSYCPDIARYDVLSRHRLTPKRYITVHDGFDTSHVPLASGVTKCWPLGHWHLFVAQMRESHPDIAIIQLGSFTSRAIHGIDLDLRNKTTLDEVAWILKHSLLHIDGESGLVRMAHALHTKSIVLFGPTPLSYFALDKNINLAPAKCGDCWWSTQGWLSSCPRGLETPECMDSISPARVADAAEDYLRSLTADTYEVRQPSLYGDDDVRDRRADVLFDLFHKCGVPQVPISLHSQNRTNGLYVHASKQWEYLKAWEMIDAMAAELDRPLKIADVGGGRGALSAYLALKGHDVEVFDVDYRWDDSDGVAERFQRWGPKHGLKVSHGSLFNIPAVSGAYDVVLSVSVLEHVPYKDYAIKEALRLLRPGGKLFMSFDFTVDARSKEDDLRIEILTPERLRALLATIGVEHKAFSHEQVEESASRIQRDFVGGIPIGMTVGSLVITRHC